MSSDTLMVHILIHRNREWLKIQKSRFGMKWTKFLNLVMLSQRQQLLLSKMVMSNKVGLSTWMKMDLLMICASGKEPLLLPKKQLMLARRNFSDWTWVVWCRTAFCHKTPKTGWIGICAVLSVVLKVQLALKTAIEAGKGCQRNCAVGQLWRWSSESCRRVCKCVVTFLSGFCLKWLDP